MVLAADVEDHPDNVTRFVWLAPAGEVPPAPGGRSKTSIVFWGGGDESPGWLVDVLAELASRQVNLTRIESRPRRIRLGHYMFFADLEGAAARPPVSEALEALAAPGGGGSRARQLRLVHRMNGLCRLDRFVHSPHRGGPDGADPSHRGG